MTKEQQWLLDEKYSGQKTTEFLTDCTRLENNEPLAYVIGSIPFLDCQIHLDSKPLIPRPETEFWVEKFITSVQQAQANTAVLDLCAGSGCIGVAVAKAFPHARIDFTELDLAHLPTIKKNLHTNLSLNSSRLDLELENHTALQYRILEADLYQTSSRSNLELGRYHYILSNPPYIDPDLDRTEASVVAFEPHLALYSEQSGLALITKIIAQAPHYLHPHGQLWLEHEPEQSTYIAQLAKLHGFSCSTQLDQYQVERYSILVLQ